MGSYYDYWVSGMNLYPVSTKEDNAELSRRYQQGDMDALNELLMRNKRLIYSLAIRFTKNKSLLEELFQVGDNALEKSARFYDETRGTVFTTLAVVSIRKEMLKVLAYNNSGFSLPKEMYSKIIWYRRLIDEKREQEEIREILGVDLETFKIIANASRSTISLNQPLLTCEDEVTLEQTLSDEVNIEDTVDSFNFQVIRVCLKNILSPYEYFVFYYRYLSSKRYTDAEIGEMLKVKKQTINYCDMKVREKVKALIKSGDFYDLYLQYSDCKDNTLPLNIDEIVSYLFVRDFISQEEQILYEMYLFRETELPMSAYAEYIRVSEQEARELLKSAREAIDYITSQLKDEYEEFKEDILKKYKSKIFEKRILWKPINTKKI